MFPWLNVQQNGKRGQQGRGARDFGALLGDGGIDWIDGASHLSGGVRQHVALIRVLAIDPQIMLMDEPFAAVDAQTQPLCPMRTRAAVDADKKDRRLRDAQR